MHAIRNLSRIAFGTGRPALVAARVRPYVVDVHVAVHAPQPVRLQGRHGQPQGRGAGERRQARLGGPDDDPQAAWLERRLLPRGPPDPHDHRDLGPHLAARAGAAHRPRPPAGRSLSGGTEFTKPDFSITGNDGEPLSRELPRAAGAPAQNDGAGILRRGYNFVDGNDDLGRLNAGLFFLAYVRDPDTQYIPMQTKLSRDDGLNEYLRHMGSASSPSPPAPPGRLHRPTLFAWGLTRA